MSYLSQSEIEDLGFKRVGKNVKISSKASIYDAEKISIGDNSRIDDFCVVSGYVDIGPFCHITPLCLVAGGEEGVFISSFCTLAYGAKVFSQSDDYSGHTLVNSLIPKKYKEEIVKPVYLEKHVVVGAGSIVFPGVCIAEGCSIGAMTLIRKSTLPWGIYVGNPSRRIRERKKRVLELEDEFLKGFQSDPIQ